MQNQMPHFKYRFITNRANKHVACIEVERRVVHEIRNLDEFYKTFGYDQHIAQAGILPDEFIWEKYIQSPDGDFSACLQMHIIEYLKKHSAAFREEYGNQCEGWLAAHAEVRAKRGMACAACRMEPFGEK